MRHEATLQEQTKYGLALIQSPNRKQLRLEVVSSSQRLMRSLYGQFGGAVERLPRNWRRHLSETARLRPLRVGTRLIIQSTRRARREKSRDTPCLIIPAACAFGTGEHATTAMCLRMIERVSRGLRNKWRMLDAGTGTGILALAARCLGAKDVIAIDNDPRAIAIAKENARLNHIRGVRFEIAEARHPNTRGKVDVIAANLFSELLIAAIPSWRRRLKSNGNLILSGLLRSQERGVVRALRKQRFAIGEIRRRGKWIAIVASQNAR